MIKASAQQKELTLLLHIGLPKIDQRDVDELRMLAVSAGAQIEDELTTTKTPPDAKYFVGSGKAYQLRDVVKATGATLILVGHDLSPAQERNLEQLCKCRVLDRTGLILDIFAQRARTFEGKLQVELAQLQHLATRLVRGWTHLERQKGGIGLRGPGETQLETDRRLLRDRIKHITRRLQKVKKQRDQSRQSRARSDASTIALVGYTNAGKSTVFNTLTQAAVYAADQLFATLDPTLRQIRAPHFGNLVLADTVGFIRHLPHGLVESFHATLEEVCQASLLLHVVDASDLEKKDNIEAVNSVLEEIHADRVPSLLVFNKIDLTGQPARIERDEHGMPVCVWLSAIKNDGLNLLMDAVIERLNYDRIQCCFRLSPKQSGVRAKLHRFNAIVSEEFDEAGNCLIEANLSVPEFYRLG